eukprot:TRINITY_DN15548_c0_g1_i1.p1 TRINITY_DN15548_c0_g1~~TRINITY_DN15548_c0_g1_i1.p1  ORF type:complete len:305 (-),score=50.43 TRINITY_DN15548_c0_g1_i1:423-1289(-)
MASVHAGSAGYAGYGGYSGYRKQTGPYSTARGSSAVSPVKSFMKPVLVQRKKPAASTELLGNIFSSSSLDFWSCDETDGFQGLLVPRRIDPGRFQEHVDKIAAGCDNGSADIQVAVDMQVPAEEFSAKILSAASVMSEGLMAPLANMVRQDVEAMTRSMAQLVPRAKQLVLKREFFALNNCGRWHQDWYVARLLTSYNCSGTEYTDDANVDFWELTNCGNNDCIIKDKSRVRCVNVGDLFLMKGTLFPSTANGLVHKSPEPSFHSDGRPMVRLLLKCDVIEMQDTEQQ